MLAGAIGFDVRDSTIADIFAGRAVVTPARIARCVLLLSLAAYTPRPQLDINLFLAREQRTGALHRRLIQHVRLTFLFL